MYIECRLLLGLLVVCISVGCSVHHCRGTRKVVHTSRYEHVGTRVKMPCVDVEIGDGSRLGVCAVPGDLLTYCVLRGRCSAAACMCAPCPEPRHSGGPRWLSRLVPLTKHSMSTYETAVGARYTKLTCARTWCMRWYRLICCRPWVPTPYPTAAPTCLATRYGFRIVSALYQGHAVMTVCLSPCIS